MNKCFLLNPEKNLAQIRLVVFEINAPLIPKNVVTDPKARLNYQLKAVNRLKSVSDFRKSWFPEV